MLEKTAAVSWQNDESVVRCCRLRTKENIMEQPIVGWLTSMFSQQQINRIGAALVHLGIWSPLKHRVTPPMRFACIKSELSYQYLYFLATSIHHNNPPECRAMIETHLFKKLIEIADNDSFKSKVYFQDELESIRGLEVVYAAPLIVPQERVFEDPRFGTVIISDHAWKRFYERFVRHQDGFERFAAEHVRYLMQTCFAGAVNIGINREHQFQRLIRNGFKNCRYFTNKELALRFVVSEDAPVTIVTAEPYRREN